MESLDIVLFVLILLALGLLLKHFFMNQKKIKPSSITKEEIIQRYKTQMININENYKNDKAKHTKQKMIFLKAVSAELHKNIFFEEEEIKVIISQLAAL